MGAQWLPLSVRVGWAVEAECWGGSEGSGVKEKSAGKGQGVYAGGQMEAQAARKGLPPPHLTPAPPLPPPSSQWVQESDPCFGCLPVVWL